MDEAGGEQLARDYAASGFGNTLGFGKKPCLLIVDTVMAYLVKDSPLYAGVEAELAAVEKLLQAARKAGIPRIFTNVRYQAQGRDGGLFYKKIKALTCFDTGNPLGEFPRSIQPKDDELVITKQYASAFFGTSLGATLNTMACDSVIICGYTTSGCIRATALDALQNGFIPLLVEQACGDRDPGIQAANLFDLQAKYADVLSLDTVLEWMRTL